MKSGRISKCRCTVVMLLRGQYLMSEELLLVQGVLRVSVSLGMDDFCQCVGCVPRPYP